MSQPYGPVSPADIRPKTKWFWVAGIIALVGIVLGCAAFFLAGKLWSNALPDSASTFMSGEPTKVQVDGNEEKLIYIQLPYSDNGRKSAPPNLTECRSSPEVTLTKPNYDLMLPDSEAKRDWQAVYTLKASTAGTFDLICAQSDGTQATYGIGSMPFGGAVFAGAGSLLFGIGLPCVCVLIALIIVVVVIVKRRNARQRLTAGGDWPQQGYESPRYTAAPDETPGSPEQRYGPPSGHEGEQGQRGPGEPGGPEYGEPYNPPQPPQGQPPQPPQPPRYDPTQPPYSPPGGPSTPGGPGTPGGTDTPEPPPEPPKPGDEPKNP